MPNNDITAKPKNYTTGNDFLLSDGTPYVGYFHEMSSGFFMTGETHDENSQILIKAKQSTNIQRNVSITEDDIISEGHFSYKIIRSKNGEVESVYIDDEGESKFNSQLPEDRVLKKNLRGTTIVPLNYLQSKTPPIQIELERFYNKFIPEKILLRDEEINYYSPTEFTFFVPQEIVTEVVEELFESGTFLRIAGEGVRDVSEYQYYFVKEGNVVCAIPNFHTLQVMLVERSRTCDSIEVIEPEEFLSLKQEEDCPDRAADWIPRFEEVSLCIQPSIVSGVDAIGNIISELTSDLTGIIEGEAPVEDIVEEVTPVITPSFVDTTVPPIGEKPIEPEEAPALKDIPADRDKVDIPPPKEETPVQAITTRKEKAKIPSPPTVDPITPDVELPDKKIKPPTPGIGTPVSPKSQRPKIDEGRAVFNSIECPQGQVLVNCEVALGLTITKQLTCGNDSGCPSDCICTHTATGIGGANVGRCVKCIQPPEGGITNVSFGEHGNTLGCKAAGLC